MAATKSGNEPKTELVEYMDGSTTLEGFLAYPEGTRQAPGVIVIHAFAGREPFFDQRAVELAKLGYVGFAIDVYGKGVLGKSYEENYSLMKPFHEDRKFLLRRLKAGLEAFKNISRVEKGRIAAIGYCFGGLSVLDMARANLPLRGVVSYHGNLIPVTKGQESNFEDIRPSILVCHGYDDPMIPPDKITTFCDEMKERHADYQFIAYGNAEHAFTEPHASALGIKGVSYNSKADKRSWKTTKNFLEEIFREP